MDLNGILDAARMSADTHRTALEIGAETERKKFEGVIRAYDRALADPAFKCPTYLHAAMEFARSEVQKQSKAVSAGIATAQRERLEGGERDGYGMNTRGGELVPGR